MSWIGSALMPHPPILVPEVGRGREKEAAETLRGCERLLSAVAGQRPDVLFLLSPHQPYAPGSLFLNTASLYRGSFALFGAPSVILDPVSSRREQEELADSLSHSGVRVHAASAPDLTEDQGSMVPLYFLKRAWGELPTVILASPIGLTPERAFEMGHALADFRSGRRWALLASGDLSHRLTPDAPAGYAPKEGSTFDAAVEAALRSCSAKPLLDLSPDCVERAGECGYRSVMVLLGLAEALGGRPGDIEILSHEGPFGVGYCHALWRGPVPPQRETPAPVRLARETVRRLLESGQSSLPESGDEVVRSPLWRERRACFVSIKTMDGELRGCIGTLSPAWPSLDREIIENAVLASTRDPRFPPMTRRELDDAVFSVDVLSEAEPVSDMNQLDPKIYGVIVSRGYRRGVLLPDLEGVDTVEQQVAIAARKAGLASLEGVSLERFRVERYKEGD